MERESSARMMNGMKKTQKRWGEAEKSWRRLTAEDAKSSNLGTRGERGGRGLP